MASVHRLDVPGRAAGGAGVRSGVTRAATLDVVRCAVPEFAGLRVARCHTRSHRGRLTARELGGGCGCGDPAGVSRCGGACGSSSAARRAGPAWRSASKLAARGLVRRGAKYLEAAMPIAAECQSDPGLLPARYDQLRSQAAAATRDGLATTPLSALVIDGSRHEVIDVAVRVNLASRRVLRQLLHASHPPTAITSIRPRPAARCGSATTYRCTRAAPSRAASNGCAICSRYARGDPDRRARLPTIGAARRHARATSWPLVRRRICYARCRCGR